MVNNSANTFQIIKQSTSELMPDSRILLFGSRARNNFETDSDYDFLVITHDLMTVEQKRNYTAQLRKQLAKHKIPADILIHSESEVLIKKEITGHIVREILKDAIVL